MADLKYKTRDDSNPQGKPRVYFCCHHDDFNKYFDSLSDEILAKQNCAIWYSDEPISRDEEFFDNLKQMHLFVIPITTKFLCSENEALDIDFKFAKENHIPVLPLMQESGLEIIFNKKCGDLQFLNKYDSDKTALSYDEKLGKHLDAVLINDELAEKIRAAFDAYVFLSYRKKDRKYAQELMRLIHKNEFCRDIAIWYDEFLTPGENFNDSIKEALQKSGLFVLAVTPNLINEPNYIMSTEYPMAKAADKPILPAELIPTDRKQLSEKYEGIPNPADAYNEGELSEALLESFKKIAIKENDKSLQHNFFIGLAYLSGIDVEVDTEKAIALITEAAQHGVIEAGSKLVDIYANGIGVNIDLKKACYWKKQTNASYFLNELFREFYKIKDEKLKFHPYFPREKADTDLERREMIYTAKLKEYSYKEIELCEMYLMSGDIEKCISNMVEAMDYIKEFSIFDIHNIDQNKYIIGDAYKTYDTFYFELYVKLIDYLIADGKYEKANYYIEEAKQWINEVSKTEDDIRIQKLLRFDLELQQCKILYELGDYTLAFTLAENLAVDVNTTVDALPSPSPVNINPDDITVDEDGIIHLSYELGYLFNYVTFYQRDILSRCSKIMEEVSWLIGNIEDAQGLKEDAFSSFRSGIKLHNTMGIDTVSDSKMPSFILRAAELAIEAGDIDSAQNYLDDVLRELKYNKENSLQNLTYKRDYHRILAESVAKTDIAKAKEYLREAITFAETIWNLSPIPQSAFELIKIYARMSEIDTDPATISKYQNMISELTDSDSFDDSRASKELQAQAYLIAYNCLKDKDFLKKANSLYKELSALIPESKKYQRKIEETNFS